MELIAVVLGCETSQERFAACKSMLDYGFANFALVIPELSESHTVPVRLGVEQTVRVLPGQSVQLLLDKAQRNAVTTEVTLEETVSAPVSKGQRLGTLTLRCRDQVLAQVPMVAEKAIPRLTFGDLFLLVLQAVVMGERT